MKTCGKKKLAPIDFMDSFSLEVHSRNRKRDRTRKERKRRKVMRSERNVGQRIVQRLLSQFWMIFDWRTLSRG